MAPPSAWRSSPPLIIYPRTRQKPTSLKTWAPHVLKALLVIGMVLVWIIKMRPAWFTQDVGEFASEKTVDIGMVGIIRK